MDGHAGAGISRPSKGALDVGFSARQEAEVREIFSGSLPRPAPGTPVPELSDEV